MIHTLQDDILREIFEHLVVIDPPRPRHASERTEKRLFQLGWIRLTHVSRHWRQILLAMTSLWAKVISIVPISALDETLRRAGNAPWHIEVKAGSSRHDKRLEELTLANIRQVKVLRTTNWANWDAALHDQLLPELSSLLYMRFPQQSRSPDLILRAPNLVDCHLCYSPPAIIDAPYLRSLTVIGNPALPDRVHSFLDVLKGLPLLSTLIVTISTDSPILWKDADCPCVELLHLRILKLKGYPKSDMIGFWDKLVLPHDLREISITYDGLDGWEPIIDKFAPFLANQNLYDTIAFKRVWGPLFKLCALKFDQYDWATSSSSIWFHGMSLEVVRDSPEDMTGNYDEDAEANAENLPCFQNLLPAMLAHLQGRSSHIKHLYFDTFDGTMLHEEDGDGSNWRPLVVLREQLYRLTAVHTVVFDLELFDIQVLLTTWDGEELSRGDTKLREPMLPNLNTIICDINLRRSDLASVQQFWTDLSVVLANRADAGAPVQKVELTGAVYLMGAKEQEEIDAAIESGVEAARRYYGLLDFVDRRKPLAALPSDFK